MAVSQISFQEPRQCHQIATTDLLDTLETHILPMLPLEDRFSCCFVNKTWHHEFSSTIFPEVKKVALQTGPVRIIDTDPSKPQFPIDLTQLFRSHIRIGPNIKANAGCTLLIMRQGLIASQLAEKLTYECITAVLAHNSSLLPQLDKKDHPQRDYVVLMGNGCVEQGQLPSHALCSHRVTELDGRLPTVTEFLTLHYFTKKRYGIKLFPEAVTLFKVYGSPLTIPTFVATSSMSPPLPHLTPYRNSSDCCSLPLYFGYGASADLQIGILEDYGGRMRPSWCPMPTYGSGYACELPQ
jgi:hypothetical protein